MGFFKKVKSFFVDKEEEKDYSDDKWITLDISLWCPYSKRIEIKEALKPYAEELGWKIYSINNFEEIVNEKKEFNSMEEEFNKQFNSIKEEFNKHPEKTQVTINMYPDSKLTPDEFLKLKEKIISLVYAMYRDFIYGGDNKKAQKNFKEIIHFNCNRTEGHNPKESDWTIKQSFGFLNIEYPLYKRLNFEKDNKEKALKIFGVTIEGDVKSVFSEKFDKKMKIKSKGKINKEYEEVHKNIKELKDLFGFDI